MRKALCFVVIITAVFPLGAQEGLSLGIIPEGIVPIGVSADRYSFGGGAELAVEYRMPFAEWLAVKANVGYLATSNSITSETLSLIPISAGIGFIFPARTRLAGTVSASAGYGLGLYQGQSGGSLYIRGAAGVRFAVNPSFTLGLTGIYHLVTSTPDPLYQGFGIGLALAYSPGAAARRSRIEYQDIRLDPVFPVFYKYYDDNPLGAVTIVNGEGGRIEDVRVSFFAKSYMDEPKHSPVIPEIKKGEAKTIALYALFNSDVLDITEGDKAAARIIVDYTYQGEDRSAETSATLELRHRNAITWDDDRKAAAFVTANDPDVIRFSNAVAGTVREEGSRAINLDFAIALGMYQALGLQGLDYVIDPSSSYIELSQNKFAVDYLKYPAETLYYGAGDCDDLSTCYNALLTSVGIETAYITVPGHIYMAFAIDMEESEARKTFRNPDDLIFIDGRVWVPVETTLINEGFLEAWAAGAKQWRENDPAGKAGFWPVREAQTVYAAVGGSTAGDVDIPSSEAILAAYEAEKERLIRREISEKEESLKRAVADSNGGAREVNRLGVLYARFGLYEEAGEQFSKAADSGSTSAMVNLGNVHYLDGRYEDALNAYRDALSRSPENPKALVGLAKAQFELENLGDVKRTYADLEQVAPDVAAKYAYLVGGQTSAARAGALDYRETAEWEEE